jgi:alkylation response protein AidB-like acyl-CoA dehydrogenase
MTSPAPDEREFRTNVRSWLSDRLPSAQTPAAGTADNSEELDEHHVSSVRAFQAELYDSGLAGITWPKEYGGQGLPGKYQRIFEQEARAVQMPAGVLGVGLGMCGPAILAHGSEEQKKRLIPRMLRGDDIWCELFSEPGSGSDLASVQMKAVPLEDGWLITGQKVWTSGAHYSDRALCVTRTDVDVPKHEGITMFVLDMHAAGVTVRPLRQMTGEVHFNEVFLDQTRVPSDAVLGTVNDGWRVAQTVLMFERMTLGNMTSSSTRGGGGVIRSLVNLARERGLNTDPVFRQLLADLRVRQNVVRYLGQRYAELAKAGQTPGHEASILKLAGTDLLSRVARAGVQIAGPQSIAWDSRRGAEWSHSLLSAPSGSIGGGTNEIIRNVLGERVLGLPREPEVDRGVPFRDVKVGTQRSSGRTT